MLLDSAAIETLQHHALMNMGPAKVSSPLQAMMWAFAEVHWRDVTVLTLCEVP